ncbi:MAG TPA: hypothetical protein VG498_12120 [Terriglobales bacterium]|nr:hypothetical protein [Terriglobales bacterium]
MRPFFCGVGLFFVLGVFTGSSFTQQSGIPVSGIREGSFATVASLLQQSHELNSQFPLQEQLSLLRQQAQMASEVQPELARQWANELFLLAGQEKAPGRANWQDAAMAILARLDPDRALELLHAMDLTNPEATSKSPFPPAGALVRQVFQVLVSRDGEAALPVIEREAAFIGAKGTYPYAAVGAAVSSLVSKYWINDREHAIEVQQSVLNRMFATYSTTPHTYFGDIQFGEMLKISFPRLPLDSIQPALQLLVKNLLDTDTSKYQFHADVYTHDGQSAKADNAIDAALLWLGVLINRDPELAQQLGSTRPQLREGLEYSKEGRIRSGGFGGMPGPPKPLPPDPERDAHNEAVRLADIQPDMAIAKAESLPAGPERSQTLLQVARTIAGNDPDRATQLAGEVSGGDKAGDEEMQLSIISVKAAVAAAHRSQAELHNLLQSGFALASHSSSEPWWSHDGLTNLVQIGMQNDPNLTMAFLQGLPSSTTKAHLLLQAASALKLNRLPIGSNGQVKH